MTEQTPSEVGVRAVVLPVGAPPEVHALGSTSLRALQQLIGGFVEIHYPTLHWHLYCHEGSSVGLGHIPENTTATNLARYADPTFAVIIRGPAVVVGTSHHGTDLNAPRDVLEHLRLS